MSCEISMTLKMPEGVPGIYGGFGWDKNPGFWGCLGEKAERR